MDMEAKADQRCLGLFLLILSALVFAPTFYLKLACAFDTATSWNLDAETNLPRYKVYHGTDSGGPYNGFSSNDGVSPILVPSRSPTHSAEAACGSEDIPIFFRLADCAPGEYLSPLEHTENTRKGPISKRLHWTLEKSETLYLKRYEYSAKAFSRATAKRSIKKKLRKVANELGLDPRLAVALAEIESGCNPEAVSPRGAIGVLQLMPRSFCRDPEICGKTLYDPDKNIRMGLAYLKSLFERFKNDIELTLAAYNAGSRRVVEAGYAVPPIEETVNYVKRVKEAMERAPLDSRNRFYRLSGRPAATQEGKVEWQGFYLD